jgi:hypothetical protein
MAIENEHQYEYGLAQEAAQDAVRALWRCHGYLVRANPDEGAYWFGWLVGIIRKLNRMIEAWR